MSVASRSKAIGIVMKGGALILGSRIDPYASARDPFGGFESDVKLAPEELEMLVRQYELKMISASPWTWVKGDRVTPKELGE